MDPSTVWHETHASLHPPELTGLRTLESFRDRLQLHSRNRVAGPLGAPEGFCIIKGEELYQLFVSREARGSGIAAGLLADAEARLAERGVETAWLACASGNDHAARFYEKSGWRLAGTVINPAETVVPQARHVFDLGGVGRSHLQLRVARHCTTCVSFTTRA